MSNKKLTCKETEQTLKEQLGLQNFSKNQNILELYDSYKKYSAHQMDHWHIDQLEKEIEDLNSKISENARVIDEKKSILKEIKDEGDIEELNNLLESKEQIKTNIKELSSDIQQIHFVKEERKKLVSTQEMKATYVLSEDIQSMLENLLKLMVKTESRITTRRSSLELVELNFQEMDKLEKELSQAKKNLKKEIRKYEDLKKEGLEKEQEELEEAKRKQILKLEDDYQAKKEEFEEQNNKLLEEHKGLDEKLKEMIKIEEEVAAKEKELEKTKKEWDGLMETKNNFEITMQEYEKIYTELQEDLKSSKKTRKSAYR